MPQQIGQLPETSDKTGPPDVSPLPPNHAVIPTFGIAKLSLGPGDRLIVKLPRGLNGMDQARAVESLRGNGLPKDTIIVSGDTEFSILHEEAGV